MTVFTSLQTFVLATNQSPLMGQDIPDSHYVTGIASVEDVLDGNFIDFVRYCTSPASSDPNMVVWLANWINNTVESCDKMTGNPSGSFRMPRPVEDWYYDALQYAIRILDRFFRDPPFPFWPELLPTA